MTQRGIAARVVGQLARVAVCGVCGCRGVCSLAAFGLRHLLQLAAGRSDAATMVGQVVRAVEELQGVTLRSLIAPSRRSMDARNSGGGVFATHHSVPVPTKASSSPPLPTPVPCRAKSICEPIMARPRTC
jgi:hypothetical protein